MERESRAGKYGRFLSVLVNYTLDKKDSKYRSRFVKELKKYSFRPRIEGEPRHEGCVFELEGLIELNLENPEHFARVVKEGIHLMYQKRTSARVFDSLLDNL
jgi:hypothetical protein